MFAVALASLPPSSWPPRSPSLSPASSSSQAQMIENETDDTATLTELIQLGTVLSSLAALDPHLWQP